MKKEYEGVKIYFVELLVEDILTVSLGNDNDGGDIPGWEIPEG